MKKIFMFLLCMLMIIPLSTFAEEEKPNEGNIIIKSIELIDKSNNTEELEEASFNNLNVTLNLKFYDVDDYAKYKLVVENNSSDDLGVNNATTNDNEYIEYFIEAEGSDMVKKGEENLLFLTVKYKNEVPREAFRSARAENNTSMTLKLFSEDIVVPDTLKNMSILFIVLLIILLASGIYFYNRNDKLSKISIFILVSILFIPTINAALSFNIDITSNVIIEKVKENVCTFDGELSQGVEYVNGQYTYRYMQENNYNNNWGNISTEGWGVKLTDSNSTEDVTTKLCTKINDKPIVSMSSMFYNSQAENIDLSSFDTSNVINMTAMFYGANKIEELDLSSFNTSNVINMPSMFYNMTKLNSIDLRYFDTSKATGLQSMFYNNINLEIVNLDGFDLTSSTSGSGIIGGMFYGATKIKNVSMKNWKIPWAFTHAIGCRTSSLCAETLESIDVTGWDLSQTTNVEGLFADSKYVKEIKGLDTWNTSNFQNINQMFFQCLKIEKLDLSSFDLSNVTVANQMLELMNNLNEIITPKSYPNSVTIDLPNIFYDNSDLRYINLKNGSKIQEKIVTKDEDIAIFDTGQKVNVKLKKLAGNQSAYSNSRDENITSFIRSFDMPDISTMSDNNIISASYSPIKIYAWFNNGTINYYSEVSKLYTNEDASYMFGSLYKLGNIHLDGVDTSMTKNMEWMFYYTGNTASYMSLSISNFDTSNATNLRYMFFGLGGHASTINTNIFKNLDLSSAEDITEMMAGIGEYSQNLTLDISNWKFARDTKVTRVFNCLGRMASSVNVNLSNWNLTGVTDATELLYDLGMDTQDLKVDLSNWDLKTVKNMTGMFDHFGSYSTNLTIDLSTWDVSNVENMSRLFQDTADESTGTVIIDLSNWNTSKAKNMSYMFNYTAARASTVIIKGIDGFDTRNVENMKQMIYYTGRMARNVNDIGTLNVYASNIASMFNTAKNIKVTLNIYNNPTNYTNAFKESSTIGGALITVNYKDTVTDIDNIINTKSSNSNVVKGSIIN